MNVWHTVKEEPEIGKKYFVLLNHLADLEVLIAEYKIDDFDNNPYFYIDGEYEPDVEYWMEYDEESYDN